VKKIFLPLLLFILATILWSSAPVRNTERINRYELISRHNVVLDKIDPLEPLTVGNGNFAFTVDVTGLQSFGNYYHDQGIPLETLSTWAWHSFPNTQNYQLKNAMKEYNFHGRKIAYASLEKSPEGQYFRQNPNPMPLGQISFVNGSDQPLDMSSLDSIHQKLDLWTGLIHSQYEINHHPVDVETVCDPHTDMIAVKVTSDLLKDGQLKPRFHFPYAYVINAKNKPPFDWNHSDQHKTTVLKETANGVLLERFVDDSIYYVKIQWKGATHLLKKDAHDFVLEGDRSNFLIFTCSFSSKPSDPILPDYNIVRTESAVAWKNYWTKGGAIDLSGSTDPRAKELERRIVLSQYLMKINYAGSFPPQETGLTHLTWYGKHNSEMYWWHTSHFYQWGRTELLENSLQWYLKILPKAKEQAKKEGFEGVHWPKMCGLDGNPSPGGINPFIIWNQPNTIYLSELVYRAHPNKATLEKYGPLVFESAKFLASYAFYDEKSKRYVLGPPIKSVNEKNPEDSTQNPGFELAYWYYGLSVAQHWRERLGLSPEPGWDNVLRKLSRMAVEEGMYLEIETEPGLYRNNKDTLAKKGGLPSDMIMALGYLPQTDMVDKKIMAKTFHEIIARNGKKGFVSWSMGKGAMTAARLGEQQIAIDILCNDAPNARFLKNGHVQRAKDPLGSPAYLPVNSSFLSAVALMAAGWDGAPNINAPGFPQDGTWNVKWEGLNPLP
jgi:hypothetical protein